MHCRYYLIHFIEFSKLKGSTAWMCDAIAPFPFKKYRKWGNIILLWQLRKQLKISRRVISSLNKNNFTASTISPHSNTPSLHNIKIIYKIIACSETPFRKKVYHIETSQSICNANQLTGFYMIRVFSERCFWPDYR